MSESSPVEYLHKYLYVMQIGTSFGVVSTDIDRMVYNQSHWSTVITTVRTPDMNHIWAVIRTYDYFPRVSAGLHFPAMGGHKWSPHEIILPRRDSEFPA